jgi:transcriptional regulator with XRE-family HTH domain
VETCTLEFNAERLKTLRKSYGFSAEQLARKAGVSERHFRRLEAGARPHTSAVTLTRVAVALGTTVEYLLGVTDDPRGIHTLTGG